MAHGHYEHIATTRERDRARAQRRRAALAEDGLREMHQRRTNGRRI